MGELPDLDAMNALERLRFLADLAAREGKAAAAFAVARADMKALALQMGSSLFGLHEDELVWKGRPTEFLLAEASSPDDDDDDFDDEEAEDIDDDPESWVVNVETDLLRRIRAQRFDLDELLDEHREERNEAGLVVATLAQLPSDEWFAIMTAIDVATATQRTLVFSMNRSA